MKILKKMKDGGPNSSVTGYWLIEWKSVFSIVLLKFEGESRKAFHTHAFNAISWLLKGTIREQYKEPWSLEYYFPSIKPIITRREVFHKVDSAGISWVLSFRGPWAKTWLDHDIETGVTSELSHGRVVKNRT